MGKNFSLNNLGQRKKSDFYETPLSLTWQLLEREEFSGNILEPACGNNAIVDAIEIKLSPCPKIISYDLASGKDFLKETNKYDNTITNPPFSLAMEFILKAKEITAQKIAMLLPLNYLHGVDRFNKIYQDTTFPLSSIYVFTRYPMLGELLRSDGKYHTGMMVYAWYIWDRAWHHNEPRIRWINNQRYVLKKGE